ncbi:MAG TPA: hypothetical protein VGK87_08480 [Anaerolineae bacterium]|jgi:hypothetical protein
MFSSKLILVALTVLGLGGFGVAAAAGGARIADEAATHNTPVISNGDTGSGQQIPDLIVDSKGALTVNTGVSGSVTSTLVLSGAVKPAIAIATAFSVTLTDVVKLHDEGLGFGEIFKVYELAKTSNMTATEILALRDSGLGWGQIEEKLGVKHGNHGENLGGIVSGRNLTSTLEIQNNGNGHENQGGQHSHGKGKP